MSTPTTSPTAPSAGAVRAAKDIFFNFISAPACEADQYAEAIASIIDRETRAKEILAVLKSLESAHSDLLSDRGCGECYPSVVTEDRMEDIIHAGELARAEITKLEGCA